MAIAITEVTPEVATSSNTNTYAFAAFTPTAGAYLVVFAFQSGSVAAGGISNTGTTLSWTQLGTQLYNTTDTAYCYAAKVPASVSSTTITVNTTGDNSTGSVICCFQVTGHNVDYPIAQFVKNAGTGTANPAFTRVAADTNNGYMAGFGSSNNPPTSTQPTSWTEIMDTGYTVPTAGATAAFRAGGETSTTVTFTAASGNWGGFYLEINEATVGFPPAPFPNSLMLMGYGI